MAAPKLPTSMIMLVEALKTEDSRKGMSFNAIKNFLNAKYGFDNISGRMNYLKKALKSALEEGYFIQTTGQPGSVTGSFKLTKEGQLLGAKPKAVKKMTTKTQAAKSTKKPVLKPQPVMKQTGRMTTGGKAVKKASVKTKKEKENVAKKAELEEKDTEEEEESKSPKRSKKRAAAPLKEPNVEAVPEKKAKAAVVKTAKKRGATEDQEDVAEKKMFKEAKAKVIKESSETKSKPAKNQKDAAGKMLKEAKATVIKESSDSKSKSAKKRVVKQPAGDPDLSEASDSDQENSLPKEDEVVNEANVDPNADETNASEGSDGDDANTETAEGMFEKLKSEAAEEVKASDTKPAPKKTGKAAQNGNKPRKPTVN